MALIAFSSKHERSVDFVEGEAFLAELGSAGEFERVVLGVGEVEGGIRYEVRMGVVVEFVGLELVDHGEKVLPGPDLLDAAVDVLVSLGHFLGALEFGQVGRLLRRDALRDLLYLFCLGELVHLETASWLACSSLGLLCSVKI